MSWADDVWTSHTGRIFVVIIALGLVGLGGAIYFVAKEVRNTCKIDDTRKVRMDDFVIYGKVIMGVGGVLALGYIINGFIHKD